MGLGVPFNIASYALLTRLVAQVAGLEVRQQQLMCRRAPFHTCVCLCVCVCVCVCVSVFVCVCSPPDGDCVCACARHPMVSVFVFVCSRAHASQAGEFIHVIGDAHVYLNHVEALREQLTRAPRPFPVLHVDAGVADIDGFRFEHLRLEGYEPHAAIKMEMAV